MKEIAYALPIFLCAALLGAQASFLPAVEYGKEIALTVTQTPHQADQGEGAVHRYSLGLVIKKKDALHEIGVKVRSIDSIVGGKRADLGSSEALLLDISKRESFTMLTDAYFRPMSYESEKNAAIIRKYPEKGENDHENVEMHVAAVIELMYSVFFAPFVYCYGAKVGEEKRNENDAMSLTYSIVKSEKGFEAEVSMYQKTIVGVSVPVFVGSYSFEGKKALLASSKVDIYSGLDLVNELECIVK